MDASEVTTKTTLADYVDAAGSADEAMVTECEEAASERLAALLGTAKVPALSSHLALLTIGANLFYRRQSGTGQMNMEGEFQAAVRVKKDPTADAREILRPWLKPGLA